MKFVKYRVLEKDIDGVKIFYPQKAIFPLTMYFYFKTSYTGHDMSNMGFHSLEEAKEFLNQHQKKPTIKKRIYNLD
jgi:hypothetical protein